MQSPVLRSQGPLQFNGHSFVQRDPNFEGGQPKNT